MGTRNLNQATKEYYDETQILYTLFWSQDALQYGFWDKNTRNLSEAILNSNEFILNCLNINSRDFVLEAGCGIGGTSIFIAEKTGAKVTGITISDVQLKKAKEKAHKSKASNLLNFSNQDFTKTNFRKETFSKIFGIESICYAHKKIDFLNEAYRIMKFNGKIAIVDAYRTRRKINKKEREIYNKFLKGWTVPNLSLKDDFFNDLKKAGFKNIIFHDKLESIKKSSKKIRRLGIFSYPLILLLSLLKIIPKSMHGNAIACINQKRLFDNGMLTYGVFVAEK